MKNNDLTKVLQNNYENLMAQIIIEALNDSEEEDYLESDGAKFWLGLADVEPRRVKEALVDTKGVVNDRRYIMETLVPEAGNIANTATLPSDISLDIEPTQEELLAIELELENE